MLRRIVIVGGGSAGWMTAGLLAAEHRAADGVQVTLIESPEVAPIGVGEGTWPSMRDTLRRIGVSESDFFRECDASFKQGSRFNRWVDGGDHDYYFHPFVLPQGYGEVNLPQYWQAGHPRVPFADLVSFQPHLCAQGRAPKQVVTPEYAAVANYGYHLDAGKFGLFLRKHCLEQLGVRYVPDHVVGVTSHENGDIAALQTQGHGALEGDLFIDCTGMRSLLLGQHYGIPLVAQQHALYNDSALAVQVPYPADDYPIASQTSSTAQSAGWIWDIGLPSRRGVGHVYASGYISDDQAEAELRAYIARTSGQTDIAAPRQLRFTPGYREKFWHRNCVAIGLSAGFIEPLEASALALVEMSAAMVCDELPATRAAMDIVAARFNEAFTYRWERVIDFLKLHYVLSRRRDSAYWRDNTDPARTPARLRDLLTLWRHRAPSRADLDRIEEVFPTASYQYILYGMGFRGDFSRAPRPQEAAMADHYFQEAAELTRKMLGALPDNRALIDHIKRHGLQKI
ncbi:2-polyprenyl-6-methoxyphenol hydroxylase-like FAD-dependent oxidoreductase [Duganella sp. SG902]|uniref:tryptophan halogenase family protein n=1 Tax=Duganella sp. SG902 TaxID=2587016 RepID=UPI00159DD99E|nr:tryptophan halogenase family protein [Duganella sp. SG902]NVM75698.1 2-polyprenyl-6-methoxyphenol hydroxylase-like FAD-dependent oxidoreductase [Duganella sp. SG902]